MKPRPKRIIAAAIVGLVALAFAGSAVAMPMLEGTSSSSGYVVRPDDRAGPRGAPVVSSVSQAVSVRPFGGEHSFGQNQPVQALATSSGSEYDWSKTIGISAAAVALALCLAGLTLVGLRQRRAQLGV